MLADDDVELAAEAAAVAHGAVVGDAHAADLEQHVALLQLLPRRRAELHRRDEDAALRGLHAEPLAQRRVLEVLRADAEARNLRRAALRDAVEEAADQRRRHHLADVLGVGQRLERDADDLALVEHGPAAVAFVDRRIDGDREQMALAVLVALHLDARDDAFGDRHFVAADRVARDRDLVAQARQFADLRRPHAARERRVLHFEQREVAVV